MQAFRTAVATALLFGLVAPATRAQETAPGQAPRQIQVTILGMSCPFCTYGVQQKLRKLEGVEKLEVVLETGLATLQLRDGGGPLQRTAPKDGEGRRIRGDWNCARFRVGVPRRQSSRNGLKPPGHRATGPPGAGGHPRSVATTGPADYISIS